MLEFESVTKLFGCKTVLDNINCRFERGTMTGIFGNNGEGKTTLLRLISGIYIVDGGKIKYDKKVRIRYVGSETRNLYDRLNGKDNISFHRALYNEKLYNPKLLQLLDELNMTQALNKPVASYSLGMKQKLYCAMNLTGGYDILLLDEFTDHLDEKTCDIFKNFIIAQSSYITTIYASRKTNNLSDFCGRILKLKDGGLCV